jgi:hypothetical protein
MSWLSLFGRSGAAPARNVAGRSDGGRQRIPSSSRRGSVDSRTSHAWNLSSRARRGHSGASSPMSAKLSQMIYSAHQGGLFVASAHRYLRPGHDPETGGRPDPKRLVVGNSMLALRAELGEMPCLSGRRGYVAQLLPSLYLPQGACSFSSPK